MVNADDVKMITRWLGFISGVLTVVLGFIHIVNVEAHIEWPDKFIEDINQYYWRSLFTFRPRIIG